MSNTNTEVLTTAYEKLQGAIPQSDTVLSNLQEAIENAGLSNYATTSDLEDIMQINLQNYSKFVIDNDWSNAMDKLLAENNIGEIFIPKGLYNFSRPIILSDNISLKIDIGATIKATASMDIFIQRHGSSSNLTRSYNFYNRIYGGGVIDCNGKAKRGISLDGYRGFILSELTILDALSYGIVTKNSNYGCELFASNLRIEVRNDNTSINSTGMLVNSSDNHFDNIILVDTLIGIECTDFSNRFLRCHHWMRDRIKNTDLGCISFKDTGAFNTYDTCYADTSNIGFSTGGGNTFINCEFFNSQHFNASNATAIKFNKEITSLLVIENFKCRGDGSENVVNALEGTINDNVRIINGYCNHLVTNKFPTIYKNYDNYYSYLKSSGDIQTKVLRAENKIQCQNYNFSESQWLHCDENNMLFLNGNVFPKFVGTAPTSSDDSGYNGQICYNNTYFYFYHGGLNKWGRVLIDFNF